METKQAVLPLSAPVSTSILLCFGNRHNHITVLDETIFVSSMTLYQQAVQTYIHLLILRCKILVGNTQTRELHPVDAGCAIASLIRSNSSQPYIIAHTPDQDVKCRSGHLHLRKQPLHDSFCTGHCSTLFINS